MTVRDVLNQRVYWAWEILQDKFTIIQTWHDGKEIGHQINDSIIQLSLPKKQLCCDDFNHELLRIYLRAIEGICLVDYLIAKWHDKALFQWFFNSPELFESIGKKLEDVRIYSFLIKNQIPPRYSEDLQLTTNHLRSLQYQYKKDKWPSPAVSLFLKRFFSTCAISSFNKDGTEQTLNQLKLLNQDLFSIANEFHHSWKEFDISSIPPKKTYQQSADDFISSLFSWALRNMRLPAPQPNHSSLKPGDWSN